MSNEHIGAKEYMALVKPTWRTSFSRALEHWAIFVSYKDDVFKGKLYELKRVQDKFVTWNVEEGSVLRKTINGAPLWRLEPQAYTYLEDEEISSMGELSFENYWLHGLILV